MSVNVIIEENPRAVADQECIMTSLCAPGQIFSLRIADVVTFASFFVINS